MGTKGFVRERENRDENTRGESSGEPKSPNPDLRERVNGAVVEAAAAEGEGGRGE